MGLIQRARPWLQLIRPGDWLILILCIAGSLYCVIYLWPRGTPDTAVIRLRGQIIAERPLKQSETLKIQGPLGTTLIQINYVFH